MNLKMSKYIKNFSYFLLLLSFAIIPSLGWAKSASHVKQKGYLPAELTYTPKTPDPFTSSLGGFTLGDKVSPALLISSYQSASPSPGTILNVDPPSSARRLQLIISRHTWTIYGINITRIFYTYTQAYNYSRYWITLKNVRHDKIIFTYYQRKLVWNTESSLNNEFQLTIQRNQTNGLWTLDILLLSHPLYHSAIIEDRY